MKIDTGFLRAHRRALIVGGLILVAAALALSFGRGKPAAQAPAPAGAGGAPRPALSVTVTSPRSESWPEMLAAAGNVAAWQEATIGAEISNYRILEVRAEVGDAVRKGQVLARIDASTTMSEVAEARATVAELEATLAEAKANSERARQLRSRAPSR